MTEIEKVRNESKILAKFIILEFAYCSFLYLCLQVYSFQSGVTPDWYYFLLFFLPLAFNIYIYLKRKKRGNMREAYNIIIVQILILCYSLKFLT